jgi:hypothetical protein
VERDCVGRPGLVAVRVRDDLLSLTTVRFYVEGPSAEDIPGGGRKPAKERLDRGGRLIAAMSDDWDRVIPTQSRPYQLTVS